MDDTVIDFGHLESLGGLTSTMVRETVQEFLDELPGERAVVEASLREADRSALREHLHRLAGVAGMAGFGALWSFVSGWDRRVVVGEPTPPAEWLPRFDARVADATAAWRRAIGE